MRRHPESTVRNQPERLTFTVARHDGGWAVEHEGSYHDHTPDKEIAKAAAHKRARAASDAGQACLVRVTGEHGFYSPA
jgi:hypothetical protein